MMIDDFYSPVDEISPRLKRTVDAGWIAWGGGLRLRTTRRDLADVVVEMKHFPECK